MVGQIKIAARSKAPTVFSSSNIGVVRSNPTRNMDICVNLFFVFVVFCVSVEALRQADSPTKKFCRLFI